MLLSLCESRQRSVVDGFLSVAQSPPAIAGGVGGVIFPLESRQRSAVDGFSLP